MSARQAFVPRPISCAPSSDLHQPSGDMRERDGDRDTFGNGKARSISAFLGPKRGAGNDSGPQGARPNQGPGHGTLNTSRRSFEGIVRPEMTPMSIIPYPTAVRQQDAGQTPRKTVAQGPFDFPRPMTPASLPRGLKKGFGILTEGRDEATNPNGSDIMFMGSGSETGTRPSGGTEMGGYMRGFEASGGGQSAGVVQASSEHDIAAPVPARVLGGLGADVGCEADNIFIHSTRSLDAMSETEVGMERSDNSQRNFGGTKRGIQPEDMEEHGWYPDDGHQTQGSTKRLKQVQQHDPDSQEYLSFSAHVPPMPVLPNPPVATSNSVLESLFENAGEFINLEEMQADWKRWRECSREEWVKGADKLAQEYTEILNMVKDHVAEKVQAYTKMVSSVEERRADVDRNIENIREKGKVVRENISHLGKKK